MKKIYTILIADRNPHVRAFLKRELLAEGYRVKVAENAGNAVRWVFHSDMIDLLILDPDLPDLEDSALFKELNERIPAIPVLLHTHQRSYGDYARSGGNANFTIIEKEGDSVERIKHTVRRLLMRGELL